MDGATGVLAAAHNHLDRGRRDVGECPGCDQAWADQRERVRELRKGDLARAELDHHGRRMRINRQHYDAEVRGASGPENTLRW